MTFFDVKIDMFLFLSYIILTLADRTLSKFYLKKCYYYFVINLQGYTILQ